MNSGAKANIPGRIKERLAKLKETIERYRHLYHVENQEPISPEALDSLKEELTKIEKEYPELITPDSPSQRVAGEPLPEFKKVSHKISQWSFNDAFTEEDMRDFDTRVKKMLKAELKKDIVPTYTSELKIDGLKIVLEYEKGSIENCCDSRQWQGWRRCDDERQDDRFCASYAQTPC
jgi:DNA ligase (NAD+)